MKEKIGKRIELTRKEMCMTKEQFAEFIGISGQYLGTVEKGINGLSLNKLITLCEKTNKSADYILFGKSTITDENVKDILQKYNDKEVSAILDIIKNVIFLLRDNT